MAKRELFTAEWFPYYFERFERSGRVATLSLAEEGAYHRAIRFAWKFGSVPSDPETLAAVIQKRCSVPIAAKILQHFEPMPGVPSQAIHPTVEEIRQEQEAKFLSSRERGLAGAEKRWGKKDVPPSESPSEPGAIATGFPKKPPLTPPKNSSAIAEPMQDLDKRVETKDSESESFSEIDSCVRACVRDFPSVDPRLVEIAVIKTLIQHRNSPTARPIRSVRYFREEIEDIALHSKKLGTSTIDAMLFSYRKKLDGIFTANNANDANDARSEKDSRVSA